MVPKLTPIRAEPQEMTYIRFKGQFIPKSTLMADIVSLKEELIQLSKNKNSFGDLSFPAKTANEASEPISNIPDQSSAAPTKDKASFKRQIEALAVKFTRLCQDVREMDRVVEWKRKVRDVLVEVGSGQWEAAYVGPVWQFGYITADARAAAGPIGGGIGARQAYIRYLKESLNEACDLAYELYDD